jgi:hypothetical protein
MQFLGGSLAALIQPRTLRMGSRVSCWTDQPGELVRIAPSAPRSGPRTTPEPLTSGFS